MKKSIIALSMMAALSSAAFADQEPPYKGWSGVFGDSYNPDDERTLNGFDFSSDFGLGLELGYRFTKEWALRVEWASHHFGHRTLGEQSTDRQGIDAMYFMGENEWYLFGGVKRFTLATNEVMANVGVGKHWAINDEYRVITELTNYHDLSNSYSDLAFKVGIAYTFGATTTTRGPQDSDKDGVYDSVDQCPNTAFGVTVDAKGCNTDLDNDGVENSLDQCPNTPVGTKVDEFGCDWDKDGDGVANAIDACPETPPGTQVGVKGCGLEIDSDQDGILDSADQCANTPLTDKVDAMGCSIFMEVEVRETLNVLFGNNSDVIQNPDDPKFQEFADFMNRFPNTQTAIEGHASAPGKAEYNMTLSLKRARAVRQLLIDKYGIDADRLSAEGYGETRLLDPSNTAEAHRVNRRIEARVTATTQEKVLKN